MGRSATGIDIGTQSARLLAGELKGSTFVVTRFASASNGTGTLEGGWSALAGEKRPSAVRVGLTGRAVNVRYSRVPRLPDWQLRRLMRFEAEEIGGQSDAVVASDFNVLPEIPEIEGEDVVLLAMAREALLEEHLEGLGRLGGELDAFTPNAIALYNAFLRYGVVMDDTVLVANIGHENTDVIVVRGSDLLFARNLTGGSKLFDEAIAAKLGISLDRAQRLKEEQGTLEHGKALDATTEKAMRAMLAPAGQILSLVQSTVVFCKSQVKVSNLKLDRVLVCGGGAELKGLTKYLAQGLAVPVEVFDPFLVADLSKLDPESARELEEQRLASVIALGLASSGLDPEAYEIEILPERVRKRRDFASRTAFLLAAGVLAAAFLGVVAWRMSTRTGELEKRRASREADLRRAERNDQDVRALVEENRVLARDADELFALAGAGEQVVRGLESARRHLPADFWIESLSCSYGSDDELGVSAADKRPILHLRGKAREGADSPAALFEQFTAGLRDELPGVRMRPRMADTASSFTLDLTLLAASPVEGESGASTEEQP